MALESPTYISDLVATNPVGSDNISDGDAHIRNLKSAIKATFPNVSGAVTPTHTELNYVTGVTSSIQAQLNALSGGGGSVSSVGMSVPTFLSVAGSPITSAGTLAVSLSGTALPVTSGGTGQTSAANAINGLLPSQTGNSGKYLTTNGSAASWAAGNATGSWKLLNSTTASGASSVDFINGSGGVVIDSTYDEYQIALIDVSSSSDGDKLWMRTTTNASTFDSGASDYTMVSNSIYPGGNQNDSSAGAIYMAMTYFGIGNTTGEKLNGIISFNAPATAARRFFRWLLSYVYDTTGTSLIVVHGSGSRQSAADIDGVRIRFDTGLITGTVNLYGRVK